MGEIMQNIDGDIKKIGYEIDAERHHEAFDHISPELRKKIKSSITVADNAPFANQEAYDGHSGTTDAQYEGPHAFQARPGWMNNKETSCFDTPEYAIRPIAHFKSPKGPIPEYLRKKPVTKNKSVGMKGS